jgi:hypothetical protein
MNKIIAAGLLVLASTTASFAQDMFAYMADEGAGQNVIVIDPFSATDSGYVALYDHHNGEVGELLGATRIYQGANTQTRIQVGRGVQRDVIAFLFAGNDFSNPANAIDSVEIEIN